MCCLWCVRSSSSAPSWWSRTAPASELASAIWYLIGFSSRSRITITTLFIKTNLSIGAVIFVIVVIIISSRGITERNALKMISLQKVKWEMCTEWNGLLRLWNFEVGIMHFQTHCEIFLARFTSVFCCKAFITQFRGNCFQDWGGGGISPKTDKCCQGKRWVDQVNLRGRWRHQRCWNSWCW